MNLDEEFLLKENVALPAQEMRNQIRPGTFNYQAMVAERRTRMDWNRVEGNWKQIKGKVKEQWGKLTDDDLDQINGRRDQLEGKIQERYGKAKDDVKKDIDTWYDSQSWH